MTLNEKTHELLNRMTKAGVRMSVISRESGMNYRWVERYNRNAIRNPSVHNVQAFHDWLAENIKGKKDGNLARLIKLSER